MADIILLIVSLFIILAGAEFFTNSVEWLGRKLNLGDGAVGSVFAAVGTAMPETLVPIIAILGGHGRAGHDVGIGAILGAPFMLATLAMFVTGIAAIIKHRKNSRMNVDPEVMSRDMRYFLMVFTIAIVAAFLPEYWAKIAVAVFLAFAYAFYVYKTIKSSVGQHYDKEDIKNLYFYKKSKNPPISLIIVQTAAALAIIIFGAQMFVERMQSVALAMGVAVLVLSLIITPIATELPEKFNSIIWVSRGKDTLALGNITGAMVFQSSILPAIGMLMTDWKLEPLPLFSAVITLAAVTYHYFGLKGKHGLKISHLLISGLFYTAFFVVAVTGIL